MKKTFLLFVLIWLLKPLKADAQIDFDGNNDRIQFDNNITDFRLGENGHPFTIEAWVLQEASSGQRTIVSNARQFFISVEGFELSITNNHINFQWTGHGTGSMFAALPCTNNTWYHVVISYGGNFGGDQRIKLFVDGVQLESRLSYEIDYSNNSSQRLRIGSSHFGDYFNGGIDEVRIWDVGLSEQQIRQMMNQKIEQNGTNVRGTVIPMDIEGLLWENLIGYYTFDGDDATDSSQYGRDGVTQGMTTSMTQSAPTPYTTAADGSWNTASTWTYGANWNLPGDPGLDPTINMEWNIVQTSHNINSTAEDIIVQGLITATDNTVLQIADPTQTLDETNPGIKLEVDRYLSLTGDIDLIGESQLLQPIGSIVDPGSTGSIQKDQQGKKSTFHYNIWSSPVHQAGGSASGEDYSVSEVMKDGTTSSAPATISWIGGNVLNGTDTTPIGLADYWIYKFVNQADEYSLWIQTRSSGPLTIGEGYTMKGPAPTVTNSSETQNYVFEGVPNNGDYNLELSQQNVYLVGNPYPSALDANQFILDNLSTTGFGNNPNGNIIDGTLYFWDHVGGDSHILAEYIADYATYTLAGGTPAPINQNDIPAGISLKVPERYIGVGQGIFVDSGTADSAGNPGGGDLLFNNAQRAYQTEASGGSIFVMPGAESPLATPTTADSREKIRLSFTSPSGRQRQLLVTADAIATDSYDYGYDGIQKSLQAPDVLEDMYWIVGDKNLTIQAVDDLASDRVFSLGIITKTDGDVTIKLDALENIVSGSKDIYIYDKETGTYHDIETANFVVNLTAGTYDHRFKLVFSQDSEVGVSAKVYLQGAAIEPFITEPNWMRDDLRIQGYIPTTSPYADGLTCDAAVFDITGRDAIVDWVWVELRDPNDLSLVVDAKSALLERDGDIVGVTDGGTLILNAPTGNYHIAVRHRNHLGVLSKNSYSFIAGQKTAIDFTSSLTETYGNYPRTDWGMQTGVLGIRSGDATGNKWITIEEDTERVSDDIINHPDNNTGSTFFTAAFGYYNADSNLNGTIEIADDTNLILTNVLLHPTNAAFDSDFHIVEQIPPINGVRIKAKAYLQGAVTDPFTGEENLMRDDLRLARLTAASDGDDNTNPNDYLPTTSPYGDLSCDGSVFNTGGSSAAGAASDDIVDWVRIELRHSSINTTVVAAQSALIQRDGDIVTTDGLSPVIFYDVEVNDYYVVIKHSSHLAVMTEQPQKCTANTPFIDFTDSNTATYGTHAQTSYDMPTGILGMWAGDTNQDGLVRHTGVDNDSDVVMNYVLNHPLNLFAFLSYQAPNYSPTDVNLNGFTVYTGSSASQDVHVILENVLNHPDNTTSSYSFTVEGTVPEQ